MRNGRFRFALVAAAMVMAIATGGVQALDLLPDVSIEPTESDLVWTLDVRADDLVGTPALESPRLVRDARTVPLVAGGNTVQTYYRDWVATGRAPSGVGTLPVEPPEQDPPVIPWWTVDARSQFLVTGTASIELLFGVVRWTPEAPQAASVTVGEYRVAGAGRATVRRDSRSLTVTVVSGSFVLRRGGSVEVLLGRNERFQVSLTDLPVREYFQTVETAMFAELDPAIAALLTGVAILPEDRADLRRATLSFAAAYAEAEQRRFPWVQAPDLLFTHISEALWIPALVPRGR